MGVELDLDSQVDGAWLTYQESLTAALNALEPGLTLWLRPEGHDPRDHAAPLVEVVRWRTAVLLVVARSTGSDFWAKVPATGMQEVAAAAVDGLRNAIGVVHPVFLEPLQVTPAA